MEKLVRGITPTAPHSLEESVRRKLFSPKLTLLLSLINFPSSLHLHHFPLRNVHRELAHNVILSPQYSSVLPSSSSIPHKNTSRVILKHRYTTLRAKTPSGIAGPERVLQVAEQVLGVTRLTVLKNRTFTCHDHYCYAWNYPPINCWKCRSQSFEAPEPRDSVCLEPSTGK